MAGRGGRANSALTRLVLETYGSVCWLRLPGCTKVATTKDHIVPVHHGGTDALDNLLPACRHCNSVRQNKAISGRGPVVRVITGPPAAGKSTHVQQNAGALDVVIDLDKIARAFIVNPPEDTHRYPAYIRHVAIGARQAAIARATRLKERVGVWIIHSVPSPDQMAEYRALGYQVITIDPGQAVVTERIRTMRPEQVQGVADRWYQPVTSSESSIAASREW